MSLNAHGNFAGRLVVFGAGYVGGAVALAAARRGLEVTALTRNPARAAELRAGGVRTVEADLAGTAWLDAVPAAADFVLNSISSGNGGIAGYRHSYVEGMQRIVHWARGGRIGTLVYTSSTSVYPQGGGVEVDEDAVTQPAGERAAILLEAEALAGNAGPAVGRCFILRLAGIYGPERHYLLDQLRRGEALAGSGAQRLNLAHRDDIVAAIEACFAAPGAIAGGTYNVADDAPAPKSVVATWLAERLGLPPPVFDPTLSGRRGPETPDRIILNRRLQEQLGWRPGQPDFRAGYQSLLSHCAPPSHST